MLEPLKRKIHRGFFMDNYEKRLSRLARQLVDIERAIKRIEILVVELYEHRFSEPPQQSRPPPYKSSIDSCKSKMS